MCIDAVYQPQPSTKFPLKDVMQSMSGNESYILLSRRIDFSLSEGAFYIDCTEPNGPATAGMADISLCMAYFHR